MTHPWLSTIRVLLRDLKRAEGRNNTAKISKSQLDLLNITIRHAYDVSGLENICVVEKFLKLDRCRGDAHCMVILFRPKSSAEACSEYVASMLRGWIADDMPQQFIDGVRFKWRPFLRVRTDTYSDGIRPEMTALFNQRRACKHMYLSIVIRKQNEFGTLITSAELYTLFATAARQAERQPLVEFLEVRMLVVYSQWVQIVTAKTTLSYITSIVQGWDSIAGHMDIRQTPWINFMTTLGQQCVLLAAFESIKIQDPVVKTRVPLGNFAPNVQNIKSAKRKLTTAESDGEKKMKVHHITDFQAIG